MRPKIISIGYTVPEQSYTQRDVFDALGYPHHFWTIFRGAEISKRHFWIPFNPDITWQEQCEEYEKGTKEMAKKVISACLDDRSPGDIGCITFSSCCGYVCPSITHRIAGEMEFSPEAFYSPLLGLGCEGGFPALKRAYDFTKATGKVSLALSVELCSCAYFPEPPGKPDPTSHYENLRANAIFGDGASAVMVGFDDNPRHPYLVDFATYFDPQYMDLLGFVWQDGRLKCKLSRDIPKVAPIVAKPPIEIILRRNNLLLQDIAWWVIHPGGAKVLNNIRDSLGLPEEKIALSREALWLFGNCSSSSIGIVGKLLMGNEIRQGDWCLVVSLGAGMAAGATLLRWD